MEKIFGADSPLRLETAWNPVASKMLIVACSATKEAKIYDANVGLFDGLVTNSGVSEGMCLGQLCTQLICEP